MLIVTFCIFMIVIFVGVVIADARNVRAEIAQMIADHDLEVRRINADYDDKVYQLYIRSHPDVDIKKVVNL